MEVSVVKTRCGEVNIIPQFLEKSVPFADAEDLLQVLFCLPTLRVSGGKNQPGSNNLK